MYSSTMDELFNLYALLSVGGKIIIDDWYPQHSATRRNTEQRVALQHGTAQQRPESFVDDWCAPMPR